jgi:hypothetical protein
MAMSRAAALQCAALALLACDAAAPPADAPPGAQLPPATLRATVVLEPPRVTVGGLFTVEVAVVTPPDYRVAPAPTPKAVAGLAIVDAERPRIDREPGRWVHRQRFRARASATGPLRWPALELEVEAPDGAPHRVIAEARPFEVVSLLAEQPERRSPFSLRSPRLEPESARSPWLPALLGSLGTLAALGLLAGVRRVRARARAEGETQVESEVADELGTGILAALAHAEMELADPVLAANLASQALRDWAAERFRAPRLRSATTQELHAMPPPFLLNTRYTALLALLSAFDALRFPPPHDGAAAPLRAALSEARAFVAGAASPRV